MNADAREHHWPAMFRNEEKGRHRRLPFIGIVLRLG
jgi:hypothetical protein